MIPDNANHRVPDLGGRRGINVADWRIAPMALIQIGKGGVANFDGDYHLMFVDVTRSAAIAIPYTREALAALADNINNLLDASDHDA